MSRTEKAIQFMEQIANDSTHGYDQISRWGPDYDCSSLVITAWENAGVPVKTKGATYTGNMYNVFLACGFDDVTASVNLKTTRGLKRGDILLNVKHHVAMYCGNNKEVEASVNERGTAKGGKSGDQTGKEILVRNYRNYPWNFVLRYTADNDSNSGCTDADKLYTIAKEVIAGKYGNGDVRRVSLEKAGYNYNEVQQYVNKLLKG